MFDAASYCVLDIELIMFMTRHIVMNMEKVSGIRICLAPSVAVKNKLTTQWESISCVLYRKE